MFKRVNGTWLCASRCLCWWIDGVIVPQEHIIGWYYSGPKLRVTDQEMNNLFKQFIFRLTMVIVDVQPELQPEFQLTHTSLSKKSKMFIPTLHTYQNT
jgi:hypothetical protein